MLIYIFFVLPVKIKWMAWVAAFFLLLSFVQGLMAGDYGYCMAVVAALANYLIFFGPEIIHDARHRHSVATRRQRFEEATAPESSAMHCCVVCKRTEVSHPYLDFRVGKDGNDYCVEHLSKGAG